MNLMLFYDTWMNGRMSKRTDWKLKVMRAHGITCGTDYARQNEIEPLQLTEELKLIFEGK